MLPKLIRHFVGVLLLGTLLLFILNIAALAVINMRLMPNARHGLQQK